MGARGRVAAALAAVALAAAVVATPAPRRPAAGTEVVAASDLTAPGAGTPHPRILYRPGQEAELAARLQREPYRTVFVQMHQRADGYDDRVLGDEGIVAQRDLTRAAKIRSFEYALDRTVVGGAIVPFPDDAARRAVGDYVKAVLLQVYPRSRMAVPPPVGGWDRDISTSEEIVNASTALDTLLGAGYDLGADRAAIVGRLASVTRELRENFVHPDSVGGITNLHQNNHRTKSGAALAVAAVALADDVPDARQWFDTGVLYVDDVLRHMLVTGDGAYAEGPFYFRFTLQNLLPLLNTWDHVLGPSPWTADGTTVRPWHHDPLFERQIRWMIDLTVPDGSMAPIDDGNPGRSWYGGVVPSDSVYAAAAHWRWANSPTPFETDGNVDLGPDAIVNYDDDVAAAPPDWDPTQFYVEGGDAVFRSDWSAGATMVLALGEHDTASEFGRDRTGAARWPESHEHADPASFLLYAHGERLALDPGYLSFTEHTKVNRPEDHNVVLVDGRGPPDYLAASTAWGQDPTARPPAEGQSTIADTVDAPAIGAATVATAYQGVGLTRRFLFGDDRYLVTADDVRGQGTAHELTWMLHGNGGGTSGGGFAPTPSGGRWTVGGGRLDSGISVAGTDPVLATRDMVHEAPGGLERTHTALQATVAATTGARAVQLLYPTDSGTPAPTIERLTTPGTASLRATDAAGDRVVEVVQRAGAIGPLAAGDVGTDGDLLLVDRHLDGTLRLVWADGATRLDHDGAALLASTTRGSLGLHLDGDRADVVAPGRATATVGAVPLAGGSPTADGACASADTGGGTRVSLNRDGRFTLRVGGGNHRPAADPGPDQRVDPGTTVHLDGRASCDADGDALTPHWQLVSAPGGSTWALDGAGGWQPALAADRKGPYRVRLTVTDGRGARSLEQEVLVVAGPVCGDGMDDDLDGVIDTDDPDCDGAGTPSTTTTVGPGTPVTPGAAPPGSGTAPSPGAVPVGVAARFTG